MIEFGPDPEARITFAFRLATARRPTADEVKHLADVFDRLLVDFQKDHNAAVQLLNVGESRQSKQLDVPTLAAWTCVASMVLNLDESITKG